MSLRKSAKKKIRVLIADREGIFRFGLKELFAVEDDVRVVAQAHSPAQVLELTNWNVDPLLVLLKTAGSGERRKSGVLIR